MFVHKNKMAEHTKQNNLAWKDWGGCSVVVVLSAMTTEEATYPSHHYRKAAMIKFTCIHHAVSTCHVRSSSSAEHHRVTVRSTVGNSHWRGYPSHHDSVQWQAQVWPSSGTDDIATLRADWTQARINKHRQTCTEVNCQELRHLKTRLEETANFRHFYQVTNCKRKRMIAHAQAVDTRPSLSHAAWVRGYVRYRPNAASGGWSYGRDYDNPVWNGHIISLNTSTKS